MKPRSRSAKEYQKKKNVNESNPRTTSFFFSSFAPRLLIRAKITGAIENKTRLLFIRTPLKMFRIISTTNSSNAFSLLTAAAKRFSNYYPKCIIFFEMFTRLLSLLLLAESHTRTSSRCSLSVPGTSLKRFRILIS